MGDREALPPWALQTWVPLTAWFLQGWPAAVVAVQVVIMGIIYGRGC